MFALSCKPDIII